MNEEVSAVSGEPGSGLAVLRGQLKTLVPMAESNVYDSGHSFYKTAEENLEQRAERRQAVLDCLPEEVVELLAEEKPANLYEKRQQARRLAKVLDDIKKGLIRVTTAEMVVVSPIAQKKNEYVGIPPVIYANALARPSACTVRESPVVPWAIVIKPKEGSVSGAASEAPPNEPAV